MITLRVWFLVNVMVLTLVVGTWSVLATPAHANPPGTTSPVVSGSTPAGSSAAGQASSMALDSDSLQELLDAGDPHLDLYGNEIEDAVSDYRIDPAGAVYERHAPDTEVPHLGPPIS